MKKKTKKAGKDTAAEQGYVHLFDSLMTISSAAKALTEEVLQLASEGGDDDAAHDALGIGSEP